MGIAGYSAVIKKSGVSTAFTDEAMTKNGNTYQITNAVKRVLDRTVVPTFYEDGASASIPTAAIVSIDYLYGKVTFDGTITGVVTADGSYMPMAVLARAYEYSLKLTRDFQNDTDFETAQANGGFITRAPMMTDAEATIKRFWATDDLVALAEASAVFVLEIQPGGTGNGFKGWYIISAIQKGGGINELEYEDVTFILDATAEAGLSLGL